MHRSWKVETGVFACLLWALCANAQTLQQAEAQWRAKDYTAARDTFKALVAADPKNPEYRVRFGRLLLERFNTSDSSDLFNEALEIKPDYAPAMLGLAMVADQTFDSRAISMTEKALEADPKLVEAREFQARLRLEDNDNKAAVQDAEAALAIKPDALDAMAILATVDLLADKKDTPWIPKILAKDPHYGKAWDTIAYFFVINRRYEEGINYYRKAIELTPDLYEAHSELGINLMRLGREAEARRELELAFSNGYKDKATVNSLTLMDSYKKFSIFETDNTILKLNKKEADVLRPYFEAEMKHAIATYEKKYKTHLPAPVQVEVYPDHEDFAVRTMGMPGLGALGVTFGEVVAMDSPSGRPPGDFHWASTLWHEMSHVYTLTITNHRIPRWFTEGIAVHEETAIYPDWGDRLSPPVIMAIRDKKLLPIAQIDRGFIHPSYPNQVIVSYYQAGKICDFISTKWSESKILDMVHDFATTDSAEIVLKKELNVTPEDFDKQFLAWLDPQVRNTVDHFKEWTTQIPLLSAAVKAKKWDEVIKLAPKVRDMYPEYVEPPNAYKALADAYIATGDKPKATEQLAAYSRIGGRDPDTIKQLATLLEEAGKNKEAAAALERLNYIVPQDQDLHKRLGGLLISQSDYNGAIREFAAVLAAKPLDQAGAHYDLGRAFYGAGKNAEALEQVEASLEAAPSFKPAQKLLLKLSTEPKN
jgi:tetratricopeptide (TPR) repeat protein